jgi:hypothetical protein
MTDTSNTFDVMKVVKMCSKLSLVRCNEGALATLKEVNLDNVFPIPIVDFSTFLVNFSLNNKGSFVVDDVFQGINLILKFKGTLGRVGKPTENALFLLDGFNRNWFDIWNERMI